jgi:hypothetical protein
MLTRHRISHRRCLATTGLLSAHQPAASTSGSGQPSTPNRVAALVNHGELTLRAGNTLLTEQHLPVMPGPRRAAFRVPVAAPVRIDTGPAAAIAQLDALLAAAADRMRWTTLDGCPDGYGIDPPHRRRPGPLAVVHSDLRLTVTVHAYPTHAMDETVQHLLHQDLAQLHQLGAKTGEPRRWHDDYHEYVHNIIDRARMRDDWDYAPDELDVDAYLD